MVEGRLEQCHGKVSSTSHFSVSSIKSPPPLKVNLFTYHEAIFLNIMKPFVTLKEGSTHSGKTWNLSCWFQSLKQHCSLKGNHWTSQISEKCGKKRNPFLTTRSFRSIHRWENRAARMLWNKTWTFEGWEHTQHSEKTEAEHSFSHETGNSYISSNKLIN